jgi:hypothetical protein
MSNGKRSTQAELSFTQMLPEGAWNRIRSVDIHHYTSVSGFSFFDKDRKCIWKIGETTTPYLEVKKVDLGPGEVIVGVVASLGQGMLSNRYANF